MPAKSATLDGENRDALWKIYWKTKGSDVKQRLMSCYVDFVRGIVRRMNLVYAGSLLSEDDLVDIGMIGLSDAIDKFDPKMGVKFETYAFTRVRGAIIDEMRKIDAIPRSTRAKINRLNKVCAKIEGEIGDTASYSIIADEIEIDEKEFGELKALERNTRNISLDAVFNGTASLGEFIKGDEKNPEESLIENEIKQAIVDELKKLPEKERLIVILYYYEELTFGEIAEILKISESRVSQLHAKALKSIRDGLKSKIF